MSARIHPLPNIGDMIDDVVVLEIYRDDHKKVRLKCRCCSCGRDKDIDFTTDILTHTRTNQRYSYYGGRGINSDDFTLFVDFYDQMYESYLEAIRKYGDESVVSLDRIDSNGDYTANNCRWISLDEQKKNNRNGKWFEAISPNGKKFIACNRIQFAKQNNLKRATINNSLLYGHNNRDGWRFRFLTNSEIKCLNLVDRLASEECSD